jgi:hypothetical protein
VNLAAEGDGVLRPVEEGGRLFLRNEDLVLLPLALAVGHVDGQPPEYEKDVLHRGEATGVAVTPSFLASPSFAVARLYYLLSRSHCSRVWLTGILWYGQGFFSMS